MKKINFALISDVFFFTLCAFFISFTAVRYFFKSAVTAAIVGAGFAAAVCLITLFTLIKKRERLIVLTLGESERKSLSLHLSTLSESAVLNLFEKALDGTYPVGNHLESDETEYRFDFKMSPVNPDDIARIIRGRCQKKIELYCCGVSPEALSLAEDFSVKVVCVAEIYSILKDKDLLPEKYALGEVKKHGFLSKVKKRFNRRLCPSLFFSGFFLLFFSFFTFYPLWYVIAGSVLTLLSAVCLFFPAE